MKKLLNGILIILIIFLITGCSHEPKLNIDELPEGQKEFFMQLEAVNIPKNYEFNQRYHLSSYGGVREFNITRTVRNNKITNPSDPKDIVKDSYIDEHIAKARAEGAYYIDNDELYQDALRMDQLIKMLIEERGYAIGSEHSKDLYYGKIEIDGVKCFSNIRPYRYDDLYVCFNQDNQLVWYSDLARFRRTASVRWRLEGHELSSEQISSMYTQFRDLREQFRTAEINKCEGACKESAYLELLENLKKPAEECFIANYTDSVWEETYYKSDRKQDIYFCNGSCVDCFEYSIDEKGEKYANSLALGVFEEEDNGNNENPEQNQKSRWLSEIEQEILGINFPKENFKKIILEDRRNCFMAEQIEEVNSIDETVICFDDNYLVSVYSFYGEEEDQNILSFAPTIRIWEKEAYADSKEIIMEAFNIDWMPE